ncbi:MAG TPA: ArgE/DapE family deacylase [Planctomycetota bacterium]|nr:ArgE/DapE family deacylase [Planctomycetota bacterium]
MAIDPMLNKFMDEHRNDIESLLVRLIAANTVNPPGDEYLAAQIMRDVLEPLGVACMTVEKLPGRTNMVARIGSGRPKTLIACHFDVVPAGDGWQSDPFAAVVRDGRVYGRGASDNKGQLAAMLVLAGFLKQHERELIGEVILAGAADEERGSNLGLEWMADERMFDADFAIIPDIDHGMREITVAEKGAFFLKITSYGRQAHGSTPELGVNAAWHMIELLNGIRESLDTLFSHEQDPLLSPPTFNLGVIKGGTAPNIVPAECEAQVDFRFLPSQRAEDIERAIMNIAARMEREHQGAKFGFERLMMVDPIRVDTELELVQRLRRKAGEVLGRLPDFSGMSGSTVAKPLVRTGIPAVGFAPGDDNQAHTANESIAVDDLVKFAKVIGNFLMKEKS